MKAILSFLLISLVVSINAAASKVTINPSVVDTLDQANNFAKTFTFSGPNPINRLTQQQTLIGVVDRAFAHEDSVRNTVVDVMVKSSPETARNDNTWLESVLRSNGGRCQIKWTQWELLQQKTMKGVDSFFFACVECTRDDDWADIVPFIFDRIIVANLGKSLRKDGKFGEVFAPGVPLPKRDWDEAAAPRKSASKPISPVLVDGAVADDGIYDSGKVPQFPPTLEPQPPINGGGIWDSGRPTPPPPLFDGIGSGSYDSGHQPPIMDGIVFPIDITTGDTLPPYNPYDNDCGDPDNYIWSFDALDGEIDCKIIHDEDRPNCRYIRDQGLGGTFILLDTGVDREHPDLVDKWTDGTLTTPCYISPAPADAEEDNCWNDIMNHGTTMASQSVGLVTGIAQQANIISAKVFYQWDLNEPALIDAIMDLTTQYISGQIPRPAIAYTGATLVFEKETCLWNATNQQAALCGMSSIVGVQWMILNGLVLVMAAGNGWYDMRDYYPAEVLGIDICQWATMTALPELQYLDGLYYPAVTLHGDESGVVGATNIRPRRVTNYDQTLRIESYFKQTTIMTTQCDAAGLCTDVPEQDLEFSGANWGNEPWCLDWAVPAQGLNKIATLGTLQGEYNVSYMYNPWEVPSPWYIDPPSYQSTGVTFPNGYRGFPFKKAATSFGVPIAAAALMSYMIEYDTSLNSVLPMHYGNALAEIVEANLKKDATGSTQIYSTVDDRYLNSYLVLRDIIENGFGINSYSVMTNNVHIPAVKHLRMVPIQGFSNCATKSMPVLIDSAPIGSGLRSKSA